MTDARLSVLHFADSAFPTGGYAHSFGLEAYCQAGLATSADDVERFLRSLLEGSAGPCDATAAAAALVATKAVDLEACRRLDATLEAMKPVREFREGSRQLGRQTLRVAAGLTGDARLAAYLDDVQVSRVPGHHAVALGMAAGALGWTALDVTTVLLYSTTALLVGAALRLLPIGQIEGQRLLWRLHPLIERLASEAAQRDSADLWSFAPGLDIQGARHEALPARLFRS
ncbi:MAG: urease accessory protein [Candidatus Rokuibacteriota bacterium]|nr:MAG: urease accessory protein [Candidatus Rokubacteria bacterium]